MSMNLKEIDARIKSILKRGSQLRIDAHDTLVAIGEHYVEHGDYTRLPMMLAAIKSTFGGSVSQAAITWVSLALPTLKFDKALGFPNVFVHAKGDKRAFAESITVKNAKGQITYEGDPKACAFFDMEREVKQEPFNFSAALLSLVKRAETQYEKNVTEGAHNIVSREQIDLIKSVLEPVEKAKPPLEVQPSAQEEMNVKVSGEPVDPLASKMIETPARKRSARKAA